MYRLYAVMATAVVLGANAAQAQNASMAAEVKQSYAAVKRNILGSADKMPAENYGFKPTPEIRSFAEVLDHVADSQMRSCAGFLGEQKTPGAQGKSAKADVIAALNDAFAECDKAYDALTDANVSETLKAGRSISRIGLLVGTVGHDREQYGILSVYLRLKGIIPPSSDRPAGK